MAKISRDRVAAAAASRLTDLINELDRKREESAALRREANNRIASLQLDVPSGRSARQRRGPIAQPKPGPKGR